MFALDIEGAPGKTNICVTVCNGQQYATIYYTKDYDIRELVESLYGKLIFVWDRNVEQKIMDL